MIYLIQGDEELFVKNKIKELKGAPNCEIIELEGNDKSFSIDEMLSYCSNNSLFNEKSIVLVKDPYFLIKKVEDKELASLLDYIKNPYYETDLVLYTYENSFSSRLKSYKSIVENAQVINCNSVDSKNFNTYFASQLNENNLKLSKDAYFTLSNLCKENATLLQQNIEILKLYPDVINSDVVYKLCTSYDNSESFDLINAIIAKDVTKAINLERQMLKDTSSVLGVLSLIAGQLRFLYQVSYYQSLGFSISKIAHELNAKEGRIRYSFNTLKRLDRKQILELLSKLSKLDIKCKSDYTISDNNKFEMFILELLHKD